ncbi:MAG: hypothetical protein IPN71_13540 [Fibrobacteres bacterium]|nr:hypothetical protein [Fibrobacterota bacterium]
MITVPVTITVNEDKSITYRRMSADQLEEWNKANRYSLLTAGYKQRKAYLGLRSNDTFVARDVNQNNIFDAGEYSILEVDAGINIHYGGSGEKVENNSAGCQVIRGWKKYIEFQKLLKDDRTIISRNFPLAGADPAEIPEANSDSRKSYLTYTLVQASFFEHFIQSQSCCPLGEQRTSSFGRMHPLEFHAVSQRIAEPNNLGKFLVSGSMQWHSGIHLPAANPSEMALAPMAGTIVAARLMQASQAKKSGANQASTNFVLIEHLFQRCKGFPVYTLLMHLADQEFTSIGIKDTPWLQRFFQNKLYADSHTVMKSGGIVNCSVPILPGEAVGKVGNMGNEKGIHFEIFSERDVLSDEIMPPEKKRKAVLTISPAIPNYTDTIFMVNTIMQGDTYAILGETSLFQVESVTNGTEGGSLAQITWKVKVISEDARILETKIFKNQGPFLEYSVPNDKDFLWAEIIAQPYLDTPSPRWAIRRTIIPCQIGPVKNEYEPVKALQSKRSVIESAISILRDGADMAREAILRSVEADLQKSESQAEILQAGSKLINGKESEVIQRSLENIRIAKQSVWAGKRVMQKNDVEKVDTDGSPTNLTPILGGMKWREKCPQFSEI